LSQFPQNFRGARIRDHWGKPQGHAAGARRRTGRGRCATT